MEEFSWSLSVGYGTSLNFPFVKLYTITTMDAAAVLTTDIWVEVVATVGVYAVGVGVVGVGWTFTLTLYPLLVSMVLLLLSFVLGPGAFLLMGLLFWG